MNTNLSLGVLVSGNLGLLIANKLITEKEDIKFIATDKDSSGIIELANAMNIPLYIGNPRKPAVQYFLNDKEIDVLLSVNYLYLINDHLISLPKEYAINLHGSLLPRYRGRTPHVWAIINNEKCTGVTAHLITAECDAGDIVEQVYIPILEHETGNDILLKFRRVYPDLVEGLLNKIRNRDLVVKSQNHSLATYYGKRNPEDGLINWTWQKERIRNWIRAQADPYPGAFSFINGIKITIDKVCYSEFGYHFDEPDGKVLAVTPQLIVKVPNGAILIESYREEDLKIKIGDILGK